MEYLLDHFIELKRTTSDLTLLDTPFNRMMHRAAELIFNAWKDKKRVYIFGNGGSASTAEHFASGLLKELGVMAFALVSSPLTTAIANDISYDMTFARQLERVLEQGDVVVAISYSGNSENVMAGLGVASRPVLMVKRIIITGPKKHAYLISSVDVAIHVDTPDIMVAEDVHLAICHSIEKQVRRLIEDERDQ